MSYIDGEDMVFNNDDDNNIHTGGFSVNSILMKGGFSPIITLNEDKNQNQNQTGGYQNVSDIFNSLVVPNWALSYHNKMAGGAYNDNSDYEEDDSEDDEEIQGGKKIVSEDIHDKLIKLVSEHDNVIKQKRKKLTKKFLKGKKNNKSKRNNKKF